jgi:hypothetical protein
VRNLHASNRVPDVFGDLHRSLHCRIWKDNGEFFASKPRGNFSSTLECTRDHFRDAAQTLISTDVSVEVVIGFEKIHIDQ